MVGSREPGATELARLLLDQDNVIAPAQAFPLVPEAQLRWQVNSGRWSCPHRGIYLAHNGPITARQRTWIAMLAAGAHI